MRHFNILIAFFIVFSACKPQNKSQEPIREPVAEETFEYFGAQIVDYNAMTSGMMLKKYKSMAKTDTLASLFSGRVTEVCKVKGCWMKLELGNGDETMVRFKDYSFFMPRDIVGKEVIVNGVAFVEEMSVEDQRHFAHDGGKPDEEIARISEVKKTYAFEADGVLINK
ncbi:DUF4920 domain-containing protein [Arenibacter sp. BSSL-BM3]|uniref:DUF4920 domain-containing protein n=1 Tax=Arenibacter arenosicollis TaxID=2762274 RepID=A0ABR7QLH9_9FLAO|nr:DUF4920 domain-containing protein [Arenibacter arenosicollis]MBC8768009.1 DUF4920 domain-containing protein [Arenibacter arenosicollis]